MYFNEFSCLQDKLSKSVLHKRMKIVTISVQFNIVTSDNIITISRKNLKSTQYQMANRIKIQKVLNTVHSISQKNKGEGVF